MRSLTYVLGVALLAGCAKEKPAPEPAPLPPPPAPAPINLADVAGNWTVKTMPATGDSVLITYTMHATAADTGWTITFPGRKAMAIQVMTMGDSIMTTVAPYESIRTENHATGDSSDFSGISDLFLRSKASLWGNDGGKTAAALIPLRQDPHREGRARQRRDRGRPDRASTDQPPARHDAAPQYGD